MVIKKEFQIGTSILGQNTTQVISSSEFQGNAYNGYSECVINSLEIVSTPVFDSQGKALSFSQNPFPQISLQRWDTTSDIYVDTSGAFSWISLFIRLSVTFTHGINSVSNSAYIPLNLRVIDCRFETISLTTSEIIEINSE